MTNFLYPKLCFLAQKYISALKVINMQFVFGWVSHKEHYIINISKNFSTNKTENCSVSKTMRKLTWLVHDLYMPCTWLSHDFHMTCTWLQHDLNTTWTRLEHDLNLTWTWLEHDLNMTWTWLEHDLHIRGGGNGCAGCAAAHPLFCSFLY